ncbi:MAG: DUF5916 domain-containing protein [Balneolaceae bacterium]|jgi:hypothetical protein
MLFHADAWSQELDNLSSQGLRKVRALPLKEGSIHLDGKLNEKAWAQANYTTGFEQRSPSEGHAATERTKVAFYYTKEALYIGARMYSDEPSGIYAQLSRRDDMGNGERIIIALDTYLDRRTSRSFAISASGVRADYFQPRDEISYHSRDYSYDPVWTAKSHIDSLGWTAEMRIPFTQLRFKDQKKQVWGLDINRFLPHKNEDDYWVMVPQDSTGWASRFGLLTNIKGVVPHKRLEFRPYLAGDALIKGEVNPQNPFLDKLNLEGRIGGDVKIGLGPNMTLNGTINPDFGQVEADPAQVNLSAYETFFEEKRPFFTEGQQIFDVIHDGSYFYSRRIGASPSIQPDADFVDAASNTSIIGASKITGRFPSGLSIGALAALTANETARTYDLSTGKKHSVRVEPLTGYSVLRLQQEFGPNSSTVGGIITGVYRNFQDGTLLSRELDRSAVTGGTDWNLRFQGGKYEFSGDAGFSHVAGTREAITMLQKSSARYYQRPDASYLTLDTTQTSLSGYRASLRFSKNGGRHWLWEIRGSTKSPGFELNDTGILFSTDEINTHAELTYRENTPSSWYQSFHTGIEVGNKWNFGGIRTGSELQVDGGIQWKNFWSTYMGLEYSPRSLDDHLTRGGPLMGSARRWGIRSHFSTNRSNNVFWEFSFDYNSDEFGSWRYKINPSVQVQTGGKWGYSIEPEFSRRTEARQYVTTLSGGPSATYGKRYIFSSIDRTTLSMQLRLNYAFTPDLTLELYAEPFVASGNYYNPGELSAPRSYKLDYYHVEGKNENGDFIVSSGNKRFNVPDNDFLVTSFRSNIVLRYQWRRGSTFYLVWQQDRFAESELNRFVNPGDLVNAVGKTGDNVIAIKFTYWFSAN